MANRDETMLRPFAREAQAGPARALTSPCAGRRVSGYFGDTGLMRVIKDGDHAGSDEPDGGWVAASGLYDSEIITLTLCRFTGYRLLREQECDARTSARHSDVDCHQAYAALPHVLDHSITTIMSLPDELRRPVGLGDPSDWAIERWILPSGSPIVTVDDKPMTPEKKDEIAAYVADFSERVRGSCQVCHGNPGPGRTCLACSATET
ncbi:MAG: hypothetical protein JWN08_64 [Frankiales bacterium]|nr:hypothetical protein [Frankiales bacterium]